MNKFVVYLCSLLFIPMVAFGKGVCQVLSDQQYRDILTAQIISMPFYEPNILDGVDLTGTITMAFKRNGTFKEHVDFKCDLGFGTIDLTANWLVKDGILYLHLKTIKRSNTTDERLNDKIDQTIRYIRSVSEISIPLNCTEHHNPPVRGFSVFGSF